MTDTSFPKIPQWTPPKPGTAEAKVMVAAFDLYTQKPFDEITFGSIVEQAKVNKASAYRVYPSGLPSLHAAINRRTTYEIYYATFARVAEVPDTKYRHVVTAGIAGALSALNETLWTGQILWRDRDRLTGYLLNRGEGGVFDVLASFATWCAVKRGADADTAHAAAEDLVWEVFAAALRRLSDQPDQPPEWPADEKDPVLVKAVNRFITETAVPASATAGSGFLPQALQDDLLVGAR